MTAQIFLRKNIHNRISYFHPWIYTNEIGATEGDLSPGKIVEVFSHLGSFVGQGFYNPYASVQVKMFAFQKRIVFNRDYIQSLISKALNYRKKLGYQGFFRLFNSEGDGMPGLIIDHFPNLIVFQTLSLGIDYFKADVVAVLKKLFPHHSIYEQNEVFVRNLEGLRLEREWHVLLLETSSLVEQYHNVNIRILPELHEKTGYDWENDQIWRAVRPFLKSNFLNLFSGLGVLNVLAAAQGVIDNHGVDYNRAFVEESKLLASENAFRSIKWHHTNVFDYLKNELFTQKYWEVVVINPPAFVHKKEQLLKAFNAYKEMLIRVLPRMKKEGIVLVSFPHYLYQEPWVMELVQSAMRDAKVYLRLIQNIEGRWDHPIPASFIQNKSYQAFVWQVI